LLDKVSKEKEMLRLKDMILEQHQTLKSLDESKNTSSTQRKLLEDELQTLTETTAKNIDRLAEIPNKVKKSQEEMKAMEDAAIGLSIKKLELIQSLKKSY